jgi:hypothetical protein
MHECYLISPSSSHTIILLFRVGFKRGRVPRGLHKIEIASTGIIEEFASLKSREVSLYFSYYKK